MPSITIGLFATYGVLGVIHVFSRYLGVDLLKKITKPLLLPVLIAAMISWQLNAGFSVVGVLITVSLSLGWIGDVILLEHGTFRLICGGVSFGIGHIFTIASAIYLLWQVPKFHLLSAVYFLALAAVVIIASYYVMKDYHRANPSVLKKIAPYLTTYVVLLSLMMLLVNSLPGQYHSSYLNIAALGALSFYMSDWTLLRSEFKGTTRAFSGTWMLLYLLGQCGIAYGLYSFSLNG